MIIRPRTKQRGETAPSLHHITYLIKFSHIITYAPGHSHQIYSQQESKINLLGCNQRINHIASSSFLFTTHNTRHTSAIYHDNERFKHYTPIQKIRRLGQRSKDLGWLWVSGLGATGQGFSYFFFPIFRPKWPTSKGVYVNREDYLFHFNFFLFFFLLINYLCCVRACFLLPSHLCFCCVMPCDTDLPPFQVQKESKNSPTPPFEKPPEQKHREGSEMKERIGQQRGRKEGRREGEWKRRGVARGRRGPIGRLLLAERVDFVHSCPVLACPVLSCSVLSRLIHLLDL